MPSFLSVTAMPSTLKKTQKFWGHVSHSTATATSVSTTNTKEAAGMNAGGVHHHRTNVDKYHPGHSGKAGMGITA